MEMPEVADFLVWLTFSLSQRTIRQEKAYTQYMQYSIYSKALTPYTTPGSEMDATPYGDVNGDGHINASDARLALRASVKLEELTKEQKVIADVSFNGSVDAADARLILRYSVGLITSF